MSSDTFMGPVNNAALLDDAGQFEGRVASLENITERKRTEEALRESEERLRLSTELANVAVWEYNFLTNSMARSKNHDTLYGLQWQSIWRFETFLGATYPGDREYSNRIIQNSVAPGGSDFYGFDFRVVYPDSSIHWLSVVGQVVERDARGQGTLVRGSLIDITDRKETELTLRERERHLASIYDTVGDVIFLLAVEPGEQYRFVSVNPSFSRVTGLPQEAVVGQRVAEVIPEPSLTMVLGKYRQAIREKSIVRWEETSDYPTGRLTGEVSVAPVFDDEGRCTYLVGSVHDITERKQAEKEIHRRVEELAALNALGRAVSRTLSLEKRVDAAVRESLHAVQSDLAFIFLREGEKLNMAGFGPRSVGKIIKTFPEHRVGECLCGLAASRGEPFYSRDIYQDARCTWEECKKAGMRSFAALPLLSGKEIIGVLGLASAEERDFEPQSEFLETLAGQIAVSVRNAQLYQQTRDHAATLEQHVIERTAELKAATEKAQEADRLKSAFLAAMSHELRTPLNSIIGFTGIVLQELPGPLNAEQAKQLGMVQNSARHLLTLINDVLDISKIEAGQLEIESEPFDMREVIGRAIQTVAPLAGSKGLELAAEVAPEVGQITGDRRRVGQVLINLLNNAIKFTERGEVRAECQVAGGQLVTRVIDTGIGIRPEDMGKLFQTFRQIDSGIARQQEGTGLGLSICKRLVELMGGDIWAESEWGKGNTFTFTLPIGGQDEIRDSRDRG